MLLNINKVKFYIKDRLILDDVSLMLYKDNKTALVGVNGCGKTTLLKLIMNQNKPDEGAINIYGKIGYLPQDLNMDENKTVEEFLSPYEMKKDYPSALKNFKMTDKINQRIQTLSGGEKTRLYLCSIALSNSELLILDEPTNHLDYEGILWLEKFISGFKGGVLIVSHDRYFLDKTVNKIIELKDGKLKEYSGNYSFYRESKKEEFERQLLEYQKYKRKRRQLEEAARKQMERANRYNNMSQNDFYRGKAAKIAKRSKAIISRVEHIEEKEKPKEQEKIKLFFDDIGGKSGSQLIRAEGLKKTYDRVIFENINFSVRKGSRIGIIGANGIGKSTLLKIIIGEEVSEGSIYFSPSAKIGYFSQELKNMDNNKTLVEELKSVESNEANIRTLLGCMLFRSDDVYKKIKYLSFGEKVRIIFLKLTLGSYNLLVLDEPTNFLDISSREKIEEILSDYSGAILFVSHDRYFIKKIAEEIWEMKPQGLTIYHGDYEYYITKKGESSHNKNGYRKENILILQMELSNIAFKLMKCKEDEKEALERSYFDIVNTLKELQTSKK